jgi:hypothetical protein
MVLYDMIEPELTFTIFDDGNDIKKYKYKIVRNKK